MPAPPALVIVDTLARAMGEGDENSGPDMGAMIRTLDLIRGETGAHVLVVHHAGKDTSKGARGHSSLRAAVDTEIEVTRDGLFITAETKKQRDMEGQRTFSYSLSRVELGLDEDGDPVTSCVVAPAHDVPKRAPKVSGQALTALQALGDALAHHGAIRSGDMFPPNRQCVSLERWREYCDRHSLSDGANQTSKRTAFHKAKTKLQNDGLIRVVDEHVWRVSE